MNIPAAQTAIQEARAALDRATAALASAPDAVTVVRAGENLQSALDRGGPLELEAATWGGTYVLPSNTRLTGRAGSKIHAALGPALIVAPGSHDVSVSTLECTSAYNEVISVGENTTKQTIVPQFITFDLVTVPTHRGKRAFGIHGAAVALLNCVVLDCWDPNGQDSQAVYVGNTPGPITIKGGRYSAGSEVFLSGGDTTHIPNVTPTGITVEGAEFFRPLSWQTDGVARKVKNLFEVKNGRNITVRNCHLHGCWKDGQQGEAFVLTPALDGAITNPPLQSGDVRDITIEDCNVHDVSSAFNIMGRAYSAFTPNALTNLTVRRLTFVGSMAKYGGRGQLALITAEPGAITFEDCVTVTDGSSLILYDPGDVLDPATKQLRKGGKIGSLTMTGSRANLGEYGLMLSGNPNARNWPASVEQFRVTGNQFGGGKMDLLGNTYQAAPFTS